MINLFSRAAAFDYENSAEYTQAELERDKFGKLEGASEELVKFLTPLAERKYEVFRGTCTQADIKAVALIAWSSTVIGLTVNLIKDAGPVASVALFAAHVCLIASMVCGILVLVPRSLPGDVTMEQAISEGLANTGEYLRTRPLVLMTELAGWMAVNRVKTTWLARAFKWLAGAAILLFIAAWGPRFAAAAIALITSLGLIGPGA